MLASFWVVSTKREPELGRREGFTLFKAEGGLSRRVMAGQGPACIG
jgi:hypothetical protein